jgi:hypothetical protein
LWRAMNVCVHRRRGIYWSAERLSSSEDLLSSNQLVVLKFRVFWDVLPCSQIDVDRRFRGACCLHHQDDGGSNVPLKRRSTIILHGSTSKNTNLNFSRSAWLSKSSEGRTRPLEICAVGSEWVECR